MSCNYAEGLSPYDHKGKLGQAEIFDSPEEVDRKVDLLTKWISKESSHTVFYTGAGISTSAGIPDFRGPKGVWTLEKKGLKPDVNVSWDDAVPTKSHMAISKLLEMNLAQFVVSQNIDGLHMRSAIPREKIAELHGNMFVDACKTCRRMFVRDSPAPTVGQKFVGKSCPSIRADDTINKKNTKRGNCRGKLIDFVLDWEDELPEPDLELSDGHSILSELSIVIGSTLQIIPAGNMPAYTKKYDGAGKGRGRLVIINLQPTKQDKKADLLIRSYSDNVMEKVFTKLETNIPSYDETKDPVKITKALPVNKNSQFIEWTQCSMKAKKIQKLADHVDQEWKQKRKQHKINLQKTTSVPESNKSNSQISECLKEHTTIKKEETELFVSDKDLISDQEKEDDKLEVKKVKLSEPSEHKLFSEVNTVI